MPSIAAIRAAQDAFGRGVGVFVRDVGQGALALGHNSLALLGLAVLAAAIFAAGKPQLRQQAEGAALDWLQARFEQRAVESGDLLAVIGEPSAIERATAADPAELTREQAAVARWLSRRYRVAPEPVSRLVKEAWSVGARARLDPTLILAIMAIESGFNPFAQSPVGAQGLMQVMTRVHDDKYEAFGGVHAAFDPVSNLRVGVQVLKEAIRATGSVEGGLRQYVGAALLESDGGYAAKVLFEQSHLQRVARGQTVAINAPSDPPAAAMPAPSSASAPASDDPSTAERVAALTP